MGVEEEFRVTPEFVEGLQGLYREKLSVYMKPMIPGEAQVYEPNGVEARAGRIAKACEAIFIGVGLGEEMQKVRVEVILESSF